MTVASKIKDLTGPGHTDRFGIGGTDLGVTVAAPDGRLVSVFGDTFEKAGVGGPGWRSPVVLFGDPATARTVSVLALGAMRFGTTTDEATAA